MGQWGVEGVDFLPPIGCLTCMPFHALTPFVGKKKKKKKKSVQKVVQENSTDQVPT
jgi:hypothetical protein